MFWRVTLKLGQGQGQGQDAHLLHGGYHCTKGHHPTSSGLGGVVGVSNHGRNGNVLVSDLEIGSRSRSRSGCTSSPW